jgi:RNA recognition motif-containing protein
MDNKLYVGNLSYQTTEADLRAMFGEAGTIEEVVLITDRETGRSKGFGFVTMSTQAEAEKAIQMFNQKPLGDRVLTVNIARPREERGFRGGSGGSSNRGGRGGSNRRY